MRKDERGAAMVIAMLILSIVTVFSASIAFDYQFSIRRVSNQMLMQQAYQYLLATEAIAEKALIKDLELDRDDGKAVDHKGEIWAKEDMVFTVEEGAYTGKLIDLQGRFNLNSLRPPGFAADQFPPQVPYTTNQGIFIRLLQALSDEDFQIGEADAKAITEAIIDWLDADSQPIGFQCGEDDAYYSIEDRQPHRVANGAFYSVSELRLICNMPLALYYRLLPYVTVWPVSGQSNININTAGAPLLRSIFVSSDEAATLKDLNGKTSYQVPPPLSVADIEKILTKTQAEPLPDAEEVVSEKRDVRDLQSATENDSANKGYGTLAELSADLSSLVLWPNAELGLYSNWFMLEAVVTLDRLTQTMSSVISRENGSISIPARSTGGL